MNRSRRNIGHVAGKFFIRDGINGNHHALIVRDTADVNLIHLHIDVVSRHVGDDHSRLFHGRRLAAFDINLSHYAVNRSNQRGSRQIKLGLLQPDLSRIYSRLGGGNLGRVGLLKQTGQVGFRLCQLRLGGHCLGLCGRFEQTGQIALSLRQLGPGGSDVSIRSILHRQVEIGQGRLVIYGRLLQLCCLGHCTDIAPVGYLIIGPLRLLESNLSSAQVSGRHRDIILTGAFQHPVQIGTLTFHGSLSGCDFILARTSQHLVKVGLGTLHRHLG